MPSTNTEVNSIDIKVTSDSTDAVSGLNNLIKTLQQLKSLSSRISLKSYSTAITDITTAANTVNSSNTKSLTRLATALNTLSNVKKPNLTAATARQITEIGNAINSLSVTNMRGADSLANVLNSLSAVGSMKNLTSATKALTQLPPAFNALASIDDNATQKVVNAIKPLETIQKSNLNSVINSLKKLPTVMNEINAIPTETLTQFTSRIQTLTTALAPLSTQLNTVSASFKSLPTSITQTNSALNTYNTATATATTSSKSLKVAVGGLYATVWKLYSVVNILSSAISSAFTASNDYVEALNLFTVSMGDASEAAYDYAEAVEELAGINMSDWMSYQGTFQNLITGYDVSTEYATTMSQNLTQLSYDLASFFNTDVETAFDKLSSAMAGQVKGLREYGVNTTVASLQEYALSKGIETSVSSMTQAEKTLLRYNYIMEKTVNMQGDLARTIATPANSLRILQNEWQIFIRTLGQAVSVIAVKVIPIVESMIQALTVLAECLAELWGYELPEIDYSGLDSGTAYSEDLEDSLDDATESAEELQNTILGIDEINKLNGVDDSDSSDSSSAFDISSWELETYDFLGDLADQINSTIDDVDFSKWVDDFKDILDYVKAIAAGILAWKLSTSLTEGLANLINLVEKGYDASGLEIMLGIALTVGGLVLEYDAIKDIFYNGNSNVSNWVQAIVGVIATTIGGAFIAAGLGYSGLVGGVLGLTLAVGLGIAWAIYWTNKAETEAELAARFGEIELTVEQIQEFAENLTTTPITAKLSLYVEAESELESLQEDLEEAIDNLNELNLRIKLGLEVTQDDYMSAVEELISSAQAYIDQKQYTMSLAVSILLDGTETGESLTTFINEFYTENYDKLTDLGEQLKDVVSEGFVDGEWIPEKYEEALKLEQEIQEILDYMADIEYQAKIKALQLDFEGTDLTMDSFTAVLEEANSLIDEQVATLSETREASLEVAYMQYNANIDSGMSEAEAQKILDETIEDIQTAYSEAVLELSYGTVNFGLDTLKSAFDVELTDFETYITENTNEAWAQYATNTGLSVEESYNDMCTQVGAAIGQAGMEIDETVKGQIADLLTALEPSVEQLLELEKTYNEMGVAVPDSISEGLSDYYALQALAGNADAIDYMIGEELSTSKEFLDLLDTAEAAGLDIDENVARGLRNSLDVVYDAATDTVTYMSNGITIATYDATPELLSTLENLGINISDSLTEGVLSGYDAIYDSATGAVTLTVQGIEEYVAQNETILNNNGSKLAGFFVAGADGESGTLTSAGQQMVTSVLSGLNTAVSNNSSALYSAGQSMITQVSNGVSSGLSSLSSLLSSLGLSVNYTSYGTISGYTSAWQSWGTYATGGFPTEGEMFIARENGAELVGTIGNRTAVANNEQIIAGISEGVADANSEQNALLKEQNSLLRKLVNQSGTTGSGTNNSSFVNDVQRLNRRTGKTVVSVGV